jgi:hypothetical protein
MNHCPSQRPKRDEWHERNRDLEDAATVTGLTISRESWYRAPRNIGCWRGSERPFFYHHVHDLRCGVRPSRGVANVKWFGLSRSRRAAKTGSTINHEIEPIEIAPLCDSEEVASLRDREAYSHDYSGERQTRQSTAGEASLRDERLYQVACQCQAATLAPQWSGA